MKELFRRFSRRAAETMGSSWAFVLAVSAIAVWLICGPGYRFSDSWQLLMNTVTSIITFLMVFLIQNTQNRDAMSIHLKLDELIRSIHRADNDMIDLDRLSDDQLRVLHERYLKLSAQPASASASPGSEQG